MAIPIKLSNRSFNSQASALAHYKAILHRYSDGDHITDPEDHADLVELLDYYDTVLKEASEPVKGEGQILHFERRLNKGNSWSTSGFWVTRKDGTDDDFSYIWAVMGRTKRKGENFNSACREAVSPDVIIAKKRAFAKHANDAGLISCEICSDLIPFNKTHFDHEQPFFAQIVWGFRIRKGWSTEIPDDVITQSKNRQVTTTFAESTLVDEFKEYHRSVNKKTRILCGGCNGKAAPLARNIKVQQNVSL